MGYDRTSMAEIKQIKPSVTNRRFIAAFPRKLNCSSAP
jgi:hypothetical protein